MIWWHMAEERNIEKILVDETKNRGGLALKLISPGFSGIPDRLVLIAMGHIGFVEVKAKGKKPRKLQIKRHQKLRSLGFKTYVLDDASKIGEILDDIQST